MKKLMKLVKNEDGATLIFIALLMVALLGFTALVVDVGNLYLTKAKLQNAADAAALAGAKNLPNAITAKGTAITYAGQNGMKGTVNGVKEAGDTVTASTPYKDPVTKVDDSNRIEVVCTRTVSNVFAQVLGPSFRQTDVTTRAVAIKGGISGLRPWALNDDYTFTYGLQFELKAGGGGGSNGYYGIVSFGTQGADANTYKGNVTDGYNDIVNIGDPVNAPNGNKDNKNVIDALLTKTGDFSNDYTMAKMGNSRIVIVPKIDASFDVIGYAVLYLNSVDNQGYITATFLYDTTWSKEEQDLHYYWGSIFKPKLIE